LEKSYAISDSDELYRCNQVDVGISVDNTPNLPNCFGWVEEIHTYITVTNKQLPDNETMMAKGDVFFT
ncbi:hypothetical protein ACVGXX_02690, partial [Enterobacter intestinihominis]